MLKIQKKVVRKVKKKRTPKGVFLRLVRVLDEDMVGKILNGMRLDEFMGGRNGRNLKKIKSTVKKV